MFSRYASITDPISLLAEDSQDFRDSQDDSSDTEADQDSDTAMRGCHLFDLACLAKFQKKKKNVIHVMVLLLWTK